MRSNCGDGCAWSFQDLEAYRRWGPGERGWLAAQGVLLTVQQSPGIRTLMQLQGLCSTSKYQPGAGASLVIVQGDSINPLGKQRYRLIELLHSLFPGAMTPWSQTPARPIQLSVH